MRNLRAKGSLRQKKTAQKKLNGRVFSRSVPNVRASCRIEASIARLQMCHISRTKRSDETGQSDSESARQTGKALAIHHDHREKSQRLWGARRCVVSANLPTQVFHALK